MTFWLLKHLLMSHIHFVPNFCPFSYLDQLMLMISLLYTVGIMLECVAMVLTIVVLWRRLIPVFPCQKPRPRWLVHLPPRIPTLSVFLLWSERAGRLWQRHLGYLNIWHVTVLPSLLQFSFCIRLVVFSVLYMSLVTRKPVFGVCDQVRLEPACSVTEAI